MKRKIVITLITLAVTLAGILLYSLPYIRVYQIIAALQDRDQERLTRYTDFPRLRAGLKEQMRTAIPASSGSEEFDRIRRSMAAQVLDQTIDQWITPAGLTAFFQPYAAALTKESTLSAGLAGTMVFYAAFLQQAQCTYASVSDFRITLRDPDKRPLTLTLTRTGLEWRWSRLEIAFPAGRMP